MKNSGGLSHIEVILSFILFAGAVGFALYFFSPVNSDKIVDVNIDYAFREIVSNASVVVESYFVKINDDSGEEIVGISISGIDADKNVKVVGLDGGNLDAKRIGDEIYILQEDGWSENNFVFVYFCEEFEDESFDSENSLPSEKYELGSFSSKKLISEKRILKLVETYDKDYSKVKEDFNLADRVEFGFSLVFSEDDRIDAVKNVSSSLEIFSESKRVEVLRDDKEMYFADLIVRIW